MSQPTEVRLIASSCYPHDVAIAARGCAWLKHHGYHVNNPDVLARRYLRFGGTDAERLADLHAIGTGPARELTLAVRGGYGLGRLLDHIEFGRIAEQASASGTPIVGDTLYGNAPKDEALRAIGEALGHQALHARLLGFVHPTTGAPVRFLAPLPDDFVSALDAIRSLAGSNG